MTNRFSPKDLRRVILNQSKRAHVGHIGSSLSIVEIIAVIFNEYLSVMNSDEKKNRFILSKGHAALALYSALYLQGKLTEKDINSYCSGPTLLGVHPEAGLPGISFSTGSLGQGLSMGIGVALSEKIRENTSKIFVLMSDAECNEGSVWEAAMFAGHHKLSNLKVVIDFNGQQALGYTKDIIDQSSVCARWKSFGWETYEVDGHNVEELKAALKKAEAVTDRPQVIIARTVAGKGVSYMEGKIKWHYWPMSEEEYKQALLEIDKTV